MPFGPTPGGVGARSRAILARSERARARAPARARGSEAGSGPGLGGLPRAPGERGGFHRSALDRGGTSRTIPRSLPRPGYPSSRVPAGLGSCPRAPLETDASVAQLAEHLICNQAVASSSLAAGSTGPRRSPRPGRGAAPRARLVPWQSDHWMTRERSALATAAAPGPDAPVRTRGPAAGRRPASTEPAGDPARRRARARVRTGSRVTIRTIGLCTRGCRAGSEAERRTPRARRRLGGIPERSAGRFPSGQRGQTVNLMAQPSQVRILLSPPPCSPRQHALRASMLSPPAGRTGIRAPASAPQPALAIVPPARAPAPPHPTTSAAPADHDPRGRSSMAERQPSKLIAWVRFPSPAPARDPRRAGGRRSSTDSALL